jgi:hypothetical protein
MQEIGRKQRKEREKKGVRKEERKERNRGVQEKPTVERCHIGLYWQRQPL